MNVLVFVLILIVLIILHELGHMVVAKMCGMRVERFSVFFGRPLWSFQRGETRYGIGWLPLGGYVKITGMTRDELVTREHDPQTGEVISETPLPPEIQARAYCNATTPRKVATIFAGPAANVLVAILAFAISFWIGIAQFEASNVVASVVKDSPAATAGLQPGDRIVKVGDVAVTGDDPTALRAAIEGSLGAPVTIEVVRDGAPVTLTGTPRPDETDPSKGRLGFQFDPTGRRLPDAQFGFGAGLREAVDFTWFVTKEQIRALGRVFTDKETREQVQSVVGIGASYSDFAEEGIGTIFRFIGIISLILAIMNLIPLLPLDGGHIVFALAERVRGRPMNINVYQRASAIGIALFVLVFFYALNNDLARITGEGFKP